MSRALAGAYVDPQSAATAYSRYAAAHGTDKATDALRHHPEQFGTLESLYPGRIDLGLGRAPGTDQRTLRALRRDPTSADNFPHDVRELHAIAGISCCEAHRLNKFGAFALASYFQGDTDRAALLDSNVGWASDVSTRSGLFLIEIHIPCRIHLGAVIGDSQSHWS